MSVSFSFKHTETKESFLLTVHSETEITEFDQIEESAKAARSKGSFPPGLYEILDEAGYLFDFAWID